MSFDRVAEIYDASRGLPEDVAEQVAERMVAATDAGPDTRFLELGVGTGRIALPLVQRGFPFTGIDISEQMMGRFRGKAGDPPNLTLIQGDVTALPLADHSQDVVLVIHVLHLVPDWRKALQETRRVLKPDGFFVWGGNDMPPEHPGGIIRQRWISLVRELGGELRPRYADWETLQQATTESGGATASYRAARWQITFRPVDLMNAMHDRQFSAAWTVSQDVLDRTHEKLLAWGNEHFGDLTHPVEGYDEFTLFVTRWDGAAPAA